MQALLIAAALLLLYWRPLALYVREQHYQEHFVYLWVFLVLALTRGLRGPFRRRFWITARRDRLALALVGLATALLAISELAGTSTGMRTSLVLFTTGCAVCVVEQWSVGRCLLHGLLMQLCFGVPYSVYFPVTTALQWGVAGMLAWPARLGWAGYAVEGNVIVFADYALTITPECSGLGQLLTFTGIAALGILGSNGTPRRAALVLALAVVMAWLSNLARVALFTACIALGFTQAVDDDRWHAVLGFLVFLPFVAVLVAVILHTHVPLRFDGQRASPAGRLPVALLVGPLAAAGFATSAPAPADIAEPPFFAALHAPPGHELELRAASEQGDRQAYETPWLLNARFRRDDERWFDLLFYATKSRSHLCVHKIANCLYAPDQSVRYEQPLEVDGRPWWRIGFDGPTADQSMHVYFAFEVGGVRRDDSAATQWAVLRERITGGSWEVRLIRVTLPGPLPPEPDDYQRGVLGWLGQLTASRE